MAQFFEKTREGKGKWFKIELSASSGLLDALSNFLFEIGAQGVFQEDSEPQIQGGLPETSGTETLIAYLPFDVRLENRINALNMYIESLAEIFPDIEKPVFTSSSVFDQNWGEEWKKYFKPLRASRNIIIKPTWERYAPAGRDIVVDIDPGMAFGTGQHPSTRMCLAAIEDIFLKDRNITKWRVLDVGTGTGILGISSAKLGAEKVVCVDIDKKAADIARENVLINHVEAKVEIINRDVTAIDDTFDLIVANLTAKILIKLSAHLMSLIHNGGYLVISGILDHQKNDIESHFITGKFSLHNTITEKEWVCYVLRKKGN